MARSCRSPGSSRAWQGEGSSRRPPSTGRFSVTGPGSAGAPSGRPGPLPTRETVSAGLCASEGVLEISKIVCGGFSSCEYCDLPVCADQSRVVSGGRVWHFRCFRERMELLELGTITEPVSRSLFGSCLNADTAAQDTEFGSVGSLTVTKRASGPEIGLLDAVLGLFRRW
jgi:hypothetical protein